MTKENFITRFAPSPTGMLHIGGARTALFNYLLAKRHKGKFYLRIEDTDKERSTKQNTDAILNSLKWLNINWDGEIIFQSQRIDRHREIAIELLKNDKAYYCFTSQEEINEMRENARSEKRHFIFQSPWRDKTHKDYPKDIRPVVRLKTNSAGQTIVRDLLQGDVVTKNDHLDDMILLRADGTPTYMLAVVVDDHDMNITHIIRGDDHLNNAARQQLIYEALGWEIPKMVHIPLIHGEDGAKLSKRKNATGVEEYRDMGYLPEALCNYLLRLGWSHGDDEFITREQAIEWFDINGFVKSPARLNIKKMNHVNAYYLRQMSDEKLLAMITCSNNFSSVSQQNILKAMSSIKARAEFVTDAASLAHLYQIDTPINISFELLESITSEERIMVNDVVKALQDATDYSEENIKTICKEVAQSHNVKLGAMMKSLRILMTGQETSPSIFEMIAIIGKEETLKRLKKI